MKHLKLLLLVAGILTISITQSQIDFSEANVLSTNADGAETVCAADLDGDGDMDVLSGSIYDDKIAWYENIDGEGTFSEEIIISITVEPYRIYAVDLDGDEDNDLVVAGMDEIVWYENNDGEADFSEKKVIDSYQDAWTYLDVADLDGDEDLDLLIGVSQGELFGDEEHVLSWYENTDGEGTFSEQNVVDNEAWNISHVHASDLDTDGDMDILMSSPSYLFQPEIAWYENTDGEGTFSAQYIITTDLKPTTICTADFNGDGYMDILSDDITDDEIVWFKSINGEGAFTETNIITTDVDYPKFLHVSDLDDDGDKDVLSASHNDNKIAWYENTDGEGNFSEQNVITNLANDATSCYAADLDGDGDIDVLSASSTDEKIAWYENLLYTPTSVNDPSDSQQVSVYPNPAEGKFNLMLQGIHSEVDVRIFNTNGTLLVKKEIQRSTDGTFKEPFDFSMHPNGMYYIKVTTGENTFVRKLIIRR